MKLGTVMSHLKKIQKMYNSRNTSLSIKSEYFHLKFEIFAISGNREKIAFDTFFYNSFDFY